MKCPACDSSDCEYDVAETSELKHTREAARYEFYSCAACKSSFVEPRESKTADSYADEGEFYSWRWEFEELIRDLEQVPIRAQRLLEIGCGEGILLETLADRYDAWGIDFNRDAAETARSKGLNAYPCTLDVFRLLNAGVVFDAVAMFHVIEHVEQPFRLMREIFEILIPGGCLFLSVPNPDRYNLKIQREGWDYPPHHLTRFSKTGITSLLERAGFEICKTADQPVDRPGGRNMVYNLKNYYYKRVPLPKVVRQILKLPLFVVLHLYAKHQSVSLSKICTEQSYYLVAKRREGYNDED